MSKQKSISALTMQEIAHCKWYRQRFDGSPMFMYAIAGAELKKEKRKPAGTAADRRVAFYCQDKGDWYLDMADIERGAKVLVDLAKHDPHISTKLLRAWQQDEEKFENFFWQEFPRLNLVGFSDAELLKLWQHYTTLFGNRATSSAIIDHFALGSDALISGMLRQEVGKISKESEFTNIFSIATAPVHQSFVNQAEIDLLKIATGKSLSTLSEHQKKYFWTRNNYVTAQELPISYFQEEIDTWLASGKDLEKELQRLQQTAAKNKRLKEKLFQKYNFSPHLRTLIKISEDFTWWQDERKKATYFNIHVGTKILAEIGRRRGYAVSALKYAYAPEVSQILNQKTPSEAELQARRAASVFIYTRAQTEIITGKEEVEKVRQVMFGAADQDEVQDIRGLVASTGKANGPARIVMSATEIQKVHRGDVLVAVMTRPDYVAAMRQAAAIVTDEGGITSHAAIVSRELGIPCIIGTKIATSVFKDGDQLEVNANHGWVRKIRG